jgi:hypothetical protein
MKLTNKCLLTVLLSAPLGLCAAGQDQQKGQPANTIALMSDEVIQMRLNALGYDPVRIAKTSSLRYQVTAIKAGKVILIDFHPQLGTVELTGQVISHGSDLMPKEFTSGTNNTGK